MTDQAWKQAVRWNPVKQHSRWGAAKRGESRETNTFLWPAFVVISSLLGWKPLIWREVRGLMSSWKKPLPSGHVIRRWSSLFWILCWFTLAPFLSYFSSNCICQNVVIFLSLLLPVLFCSPFLVCHVMLYTCFDCLPRPDLFHLSPVNIPFFVYASLVSSFLC